MKAKKRSATTVYVDALERIIYECQQVATQVEQVDKAEARAWQSVASIALHALREAGAR